MIVKILFKCILFVFLTILTQIGGIVYILSLYLAKKWKSNLKFKSILTFITLYLCLTFFVIPLIAPIFGREKVKHSNKIKPTNYMTVILNRNYVRPELNLVLAQTEKELKATTIQIHYLDANFPFINKFPLPPHLSHNDGKKIDLSLIYKTATGEISTQQKSISGYGVFESPTSNEFDQINSCLKRGHFQYDYSKYVTFGTIHKELVFSEKGTKKLIKSILKNASLGKLFIEPHLKQRLHLTHKKIRYHGCQAVRHDDHIHIQLK